MIWFTFKFFVAIMVGGTAGMIAAHLCWALILYAIGRFLDWMYPPIPSKGFLTGVTI